MKKKSKSVIINKTPITKSAIDLVDSRQNHSSFKYKYKNNQSSYYLQSQVYVHHENMDKSPKLIGSASNVDFRMKNPGKIKYHALINGTHLTITIDAVTKHTQIIVNEHHEDPVKMYNRNTITISRQKYIFIVNNNDHPSQTVYTNLKKNQLHHQINESVDLGDQKIDYRYEQIVSSNRDTSSRLALNKAFIASNLALCLFISYAMYPKNTLADGQLHNGDSAYNISVDSKKERHQIVSQEKNHATGNTTQATKKDNLIVNKNNMVRMHKKDLVTQVDAVMIRKSHSISKTKAKILHEKSKSKNNINLAIRYFHQGKLLKSLSLLKAIEKSHRYAPEHRQEAKNKAKLFSKLDILYQKGYLAKQNNNYHETSLHWGFLLRELERNYPGVNNKYLMSMKTSIAQEYEQRGNNAYAIDDWPTAYLNWKKSNNLIRKTEITRALKMMDDEIQRIYLIAYRFETVNLSKARQYLNKVLEKSPENHPYHIRAQAQLAWYERN